ncbi:DUF5821 family protein [Haloarculaceae archaeon H-GB2-1]|nr:DUF5821 family protein [Haloarculaceae archaeon H-GB1-1]MEA5385954.1 DUF5821 family protein [Haloarculaceae archaeon H-GB11]MEA5407460.1 DUF5821 family protein [Haloarculaceae archaeon H-GB2-1]
MDANYLGDGVEELLRGALADVSGQVKVVNPSQETIKSLVTCLGELDDDTTVDLLANERKLKSVMDDFLIASNAADLIAADTLTIRVRESLPENSLLVSENAVVSLVFAGDRVGGLSTDNDAFVTQARDYYDEQWETADEFGLRTPPLSQVRETLESDIGPETATDFDAVLDSLQTARGNGEGLDEVTISLLVAAKNGELLYDISKWGEDIGLASKATFSRTKTKLEDMGLIDTEKVPIDVGRPRLRLMLGDDRLDSADTDELANVAQSLLA